jgi:phosphatidylglycerol:prolipoprotein diacylglycerol transferase
LKRLGHKPALAGDIVFAAAVGGIVGSRIYFLLENFEQFLNDPIGMIFSGGGLVFLGGLLGGLLAVTYIIKKNNLRWIAFADIVAPLLILGYAIGRVGCLLVGDDYGLPTNLPWGMEFPNGIPPSTYQIFQSRYPWVDLSGFSPGVLKVHPTQIYETLIGSGIFYYLYQKRQSVKVVGSLFFTYLTLAGAERFMIEFLRINQKYFLGLSGAQLISVTMLSIGLWFLYHPVGQIEGHATKEK